MKATVLYGPRDIRFEQRDDPKIVEPTDAILRISAACVCGSDLWPYRGIQPIGKPTPMGHEYVGVVEEIGGAVKTIKRGQFVIGSFVFSDNTCPNCRYGYPSGCMNREFASGAQAPLFRVPMADGGVGADSVLECVGTQEAMMQRDIARWTSVVRSRRFSCQIETRTI
jgi:threonine dehydrogenase-like Zn-dependent dehydrogenase